jgi:DNA-binding phage protein
MKAIKTSRSHDEAVIDMLKNDPDFANEYLAVALEEADQPGGQQALLSALRHIAEAQGMSAVAERAGNTSCEFIQSIRLTRQSNHQDASCSSRCIRSAFVCGT